MVRVFDAAMIFDCFAEFFGAERVQSGDEERKQNEEKEAESGEEGKRLTFLLPAKSDPE